MSILQDWQWEFLDALIAGDVEKARRLVYQNEGEQLSMF